MVKYEQISFKIRRFLLTRGFVDLLVDGGKLRIATSPSLPVCLNKCTRCWHAITLAAILLDMAFVSIALLLAGSYRRPEKVCSRT